MRIVALDALRGFAALAVAAPHFLIAHHIHHTFFQAVSIVSVEVFFVLSGFVLAPQILQCVKSGSQKNLSVFLLSTLDAHSPAIRHRALRRCNVHLEFVHAAVPAIFVFRTEPGVDRRFERFLSGSLESFYRRMVLSVIPDFSVGACTGPLLTWRQATVAANRCGHGNSA
jgi:hypothetical protein